MNLRNHMVWGAVLLICLFLLGCKGESGADHAGAYSVRDAKGTEVQLAKKPDKILTLSIGCDTIVLGLVTSDHMAAVNALLDDPNSSNIAPIAARVKQKIKNPTAEEILAMRPDLVIVPDWKDIKIVDSLRELGIPVLVVKGAVNLSEIKENIEMIAAALDEQEKGRQLIAMMDKELADIQEKVSRIPEGDRKNVVLISLMTSYGGIGCAYDDACRYAGVINGISAAGLHNGQMLTKELLVKIDPDILLMPVYNDHGQFDTQQFVDEYLLDPSLQSMKAIRAGAVVYPRDGYIYNVSQDFVYGVREIARSAYGEAFDFPDAMHLSVSGEKNE